MRFAKYSLHLFPAVAILSGLLIAQEQVTGFPAVVPQLVNYSGKAIDSGGHPVVGMQGMTFAIYSEQLNGSPLWIETQNVQPDANGNYTVQLGAATTGGLPLNLFSSGEARWLGVRINGGEEPPRVLLLSVPYALKAADAETVGGLPPSAFVLAAPGASAAAAPESSAASVAGVPPVGGSGTENYIPIWTDSSGDLGNSVIFQSGTGSTAKIGINEKNPLLTLDVNGSQLMRGLFEMATMNYATPTKGYDSQPFNLESSAYNSGTKAYTLNHFQWQAEPVGNNTTTPGATLNLLYGTDPASPSETGLSISSKGIFSFAPGQTFPGGSGTVTSVGLSAPSSDFTVSGSPVTTSGTLGLNWSVAPTSSDTANAIVKRDANGSFSAGPITAANLPGVFSYGVTGTDSGTELGNFGGVYGVSISNVGVTGYSTYLDGVYGASDGYYGVDGSGNNAGVHGFGIYGVYGETNSGYGVYGSGFQSANGVYGTSTGDGVGVYGTSQTATGVSGSGGNYGVTGFGATGVYGSGTTGNGVTAFNSAGGYGIYSYSSGFTAYFDGPNGRCHVDGSGNLACTGSKSAVVPVDDGTRHVALYAVEAPENWFEDFGSATLSNGKAVVPLDPTFTQTVNTGVDYHVFLTPNGDSNGLYLAAKSTTTFEIDEQGGGTSNIAFDYRIVARRRGYENIRLADMTTDFTVKQFQPIARPKVPPIPAAPVNKPGRLPAKPLLRNTSTPP